MPLLIPAPSGPDSSTEEIWDVEPTGTGSVPLTNRLALLCLAATTLGAAQFLSPSLAVPDLLERSSWIEYGGRGQPGSRGPSVAIPCSVSEKLARIRANLSLNVSELARVLKVKRPTIYAWMRDDAAILRSENRLRIDRLHSLARRWEARSKLPIEGLVRETNEAGESLVSLLEANRFEDAAYLIEALVERRMKAPERRIPSVRESLERHGLAHRTRPSQEEIDRVAR